MRGTGDTGAHERLAAQASREDEGLWDQEYERRLFDWAAERVRGLTGPSVWQAFWQTAVEGKRPRDVARALGLRLLLADVSSRERALEDQRRRLSRADAG